MHFELKTRAESTLLFSFIRIHPKELTSLERRYSNERINRDISLNKCNTNHAAQVVVF